MSLQMPIGGEARLPIVPNLQDKELEKFLQGLRREVERVSSALLINDRAIINAINLGTSFTATSTVLGIVVTSGIVTSVTT